MMSHSAIHTFVALLVVCHNCLQPRALQDIPQAIEIAPSSDLIRVDRRVDPLLNLTAVTYDEMVRRNAAQGIQLGRAYWDTLVEVSKYQNLVRTGLNCAGSCTFSYIWLDENGETQTVGVGSLTRMYKLTSCQESDCKCPGEVLLTRPSMRATISMNTCSMAPAFLKEQKPAHQHPEQQQQQLPLEKQSGTHVVTSQSGSTAVAPRWGSMPIASMAFLVCALLALGLVLGMWEAKKREVGSRLKSAGT